MRALSMGMQLAGLAALMPMGEPISVTVPKRYSRPLGSDELNRREARQQVSRTARKNKEHRLKGVRP